MRATESSGCGFRSAWKRASKERRAFVIAEASVIGTMRCSWFFVPPSPPVTPSVFLAKSTWAHRRAARFPRAGIPEWMHLRSPSQTPVRDAALLEPKRVSGCYKRQRVDAARTADLNPLVALAATESPLAQLRGFPHSRLLASIRGSTRDLQRGTSPPFSIPKPVRWTKRSVNSKPALRVIAITKLTAAISQEKPRMSVRRRDRACACAPGGFFPLFGQLPT